MVLRITGATNVKAEAKVLVPSGVVTETPTLPAERAGVVTVMLVAVFAVINAVRAAILHRLVPA